ncbi:sulfurtransferase FdhD [Limnohabitans sp. T6-5]|uniref:formate dehydrogenase accessory sulfurtransferase FdhD n=1 Tax=Limnohabitans sp. T6-5 TaxID=1100724 RepID=UPI000D3D87F7|nr:formate dehydrogenase accessory sulfurtransferase FdhD [Limnohabitans sp. T6-5]PUE11475.1 sulfurtransferase FdhD [Limnohabitans sp. T6-5]
MSAVVIDSPTKPHLTQTRARLTRTVPVVDERGEPLKTAIPAERALTVYLDKHELVTLMTLGAQPELLVLGFLRNQRLIDSVDQIESITVDWTVGEGEVGEPGVAAVKTRPGAEVIVQRSAERVVTTGCGQGSVFGDLMAHLDDIQLPPAQITQGQLYGLVNAIRLQETTYKSSGSVHGCALFEGDKMVMFVEDVGRHNAVDTIAGWMWMNDISGHNKVFYTTGRLTSEMVIKSAQMGIPVVVSRSGITQMGLDVANRLGLCAIGRATNKRFLCFSGAERLVWQPELVDKTSNS